jgi:hypothetical protein
MGNKKQKQKLFDSDKPTERIKSDTLKGDSEPFDLFDLLSMSVGPDISQGETLEAHSEAFDPSKRSWSDLFGLTINGSSAHLDNVNYHLVPFKKMRVKDLIAIREFLTPEWQEKTGRFARHNGSLTLNELIYMMAFDDQCNRILQQLWDRLDLNNKEIKFKYGPFNPDALGTTDAWFYLWDRMSGTDVGKFLFNLSEKEPDGLKQLRPINLYTDVLCEKQVDMQSEGRNEDCYVKLDELSEYLGDIKDAFNISIPLPKLLSPKDPETQESLDESLPVSSHSERDKITVNQDPKINEEILEILREAMPEIEMIYSANSVRLRK